MVRLIQFLFFASVLLTVMSFVNNQDKYLGVWASENGKYPMDSLDTLFLKRNRKFNIIRYEPRYYPPITYSGTWKINKDTLTLIEESCTGCNLNKPGIQKLDRKKITKLEILNHGENEIYFYQHLKYSFYKVNR